MRANRVFCGKHTNRCGVFEIASRSERLAATDPERVIGINAAMAKVGRTDVAPRREATAPMPARAAEFSGVAVRDAPSAG